MQGHDAHLLGHSNLRGEDDGTQVPLANLGSRENRTMFARQPKPNPQPPHEWAKNIPLGMNQQQ